MEPILMSIQAGYLVKGTLSAMQAGIVVNGCLYVSYRCARRLCKDLSKDLNSLRTKRYTVSEFMEQSGNRHE